MSGSSQNLILETFQQQLEEDLWTDKKHKKCLGKLYFIPIQVFFPPPSPPPPPTNFFSVTSTNVGISPKRFLTFSFSPFATLV